MLLFELQQNECEVNMARGRPPRISVPLSQQAEAWLEALVAERNISKNTLQAYRGDIERIEISLKKQNKNLMTAYHEDLLRALSGDEKPRSRARRLSSLRSFYGFAMSEGWLKKNPVAKISFRKRDRTLPQILAIEEIERLIQATELLPGDESLRGKAILELLYGGGLRVSELIGLTLGDIEPEHQTLHVCGKGDIERSTPLHATAWSALQDWLGVVLKSSAQSSVKVLSPSRQFLFPSKSSRSGHISRQRVGQILKQLADLTGLSRDRIYPHCLRHSFATHLVDGGADLRSVQHLLGHARIGTTEIYTHVAGRKLRDAVDSYHPLSTFSEVSK